MARTRLHAAPAPRRDNYPEPPPAHRRDVLALQQWLEDQMLRLQRTLQQQQQQLQGSKAASPRELPSPSSPAMGAPGDGSQEWKLTDNGRSSVQVARDEEGFISTPVLAHQEQLLTKAMEELCGQTATWVLRCAVARAISAPPPSCRACVRPGSRAWRGGTQAMRLPPPHTRAKATLLHWLHRRVCVERGHFMWQLWAALRHMLRLVLQDREAARWGCWAAAVHGAAAWAGPARGRTWPHGWAAQRCHMAHRPLASAHAGADAGVVWRRNITREARRSELTVVDSVHAEQAVTKSAMDEVAHMNEVLNRWNHYAVCMKLLQHVARCMRSCAQAVAA